MSKLIKTLSIIVTVLASIGIVGAILMGARAHAAHTVSGNNSTVYIDIKTGKQVSAVEADRIATLAGPDSPPAVMGCKPMDKECNERTGKCTLKNVK